MSDKKNGLIRTMKALESCVCLKGKVVKGFQRGSKLLGWPTANLDPKAFENKIDHLDQGVYFGLAKIATHEKVFKTALSVGWNPHFKNKEKTVEAYLVNEFKEDFYGVEMRLMIVGHVRPQIPFDGLESLKKAIQGDVDATVQVLELQKYAKLYTDDFFSDSTAKSQL